MDFVAIPIIVLLTYIIGDIMKLFLSPKQYKVIPLIVTILGGVLGILIYYSEPNILLVFDNYWDALGICLISGASATGTNQIIKQLFAHKNNA